MMEKKKSSLQRSTNTFTIQKEKKTGFNLYMPMKQRIFMQDVTVPFKKLPRTRRMDTFHHNAVEKEEMWTSYC